MNLHFLEGRTASQGEFAHFELVLVQVPLLRKSSVASLTNEFLADYRVDEDVRAEVGLVSESLSAAWMVALVRPFSCVRAHVSFEQPRTRKVFVANRTPVV